MVWKFEDFRYFDRDLGAVDGCHATRTKRCTIPRLQLVEKAWAKTLQNYTDKTISFDTSPSRDAATRANTLGVQEEYRKRSTGETEHRDKRCRLAAKFGLTVYNSRVLV